MPSSSITDLQILNNGYRIDAPENVMPIKVSDLWSALEQADDWVAQHGNPFQNEETFSTRYPKMPVDLAEALASHPALASSDEVKHQETQMLFDKASKNQESPHLALRQAAWYVGEAVARSVGIISSTALGFIRGAALGAGRSTIPRVGRRAIFGVAPALVRNDFNLAHIILKAGLEMRKIL